jgi:ribosome-associated protein
VSEDLHVGAKLVIPASDLSWKAVRSGGPGGQNVNKVASKVDLRFDLPGTSALGSDVKARLRRIARNKLDAEGRIVVTSQVTRDQARNLDDAREKLAEMIAEALRKPKRRKPTKPSRGAKERRLKEKRVRKERKQGRGRVDW